MKNLVIEMHELIPYAMNAANSGEFGEVKTYMQDAMWY